MSAQGDLYRTQNLKALQALVDRQTDGQRLHVVMADGGFDVSGAENIQEVLNKQLLLTQFAAALGCLGEGGHFVCKAFDLFTPFSAGLLYVMYRCFDAVCVYKPAASRPANSERYVLRKGLPLTLTLTPTLTLNLTLTLTLTPTLTLTLTLHRTSRTRCRGTSTWTTTRPTTSFTCPSRTCATRTPPSSSRHACRRCSRI